MTRELGLARGERPRAIRKSTRILNRSIVPEPHQRTNGCADTYKRVPCGNRSTADSQRPGSTQTTGGPDGEI